MADDSLITQEQYNADIKRLYDEKIYPYLNGATHVGCVPVGSRLDGWFTTTPKYYLYCDGAEYLKSDYPELAELLAQIDEANSTTQYVGSDANHFKVPDLRGEFIRGTGTNGHTDQGDGANVGVHQDGTLSVSLFAAKDNRVGINRIPSSSTVTQNFDKVQQTGSSYYQLNGTANSVGSDTASGTTRPTNTSLPQYICYKTHYIDLALDSFPLDITQPTDGQLLMYDATAGRWVNGGHKYSTDEHVVGTWIDSKPLYEKTFYIPSPIGDQELLSDVAFCYTIAKTYNRIEVGNDCDDFWNNSSNYTNIRGFLNSSTHKVVLAICKPSNYTLTDVYITLQYTKTTDTV